jgi:hypothetical protein
MMTPRTSARWRNPILRATQNLDRRDFDYSSDFFDAANGIAWDAAGRPDDTPGSEWWDWETEALRHIERKFR